MRTFLVLCGLALAAIPFGVTLPTAEGMVELPRASVTVHIDATGTRHVAHHPVAIAPPVDATHDPALYDALAPLAWGPERRVRLLADRDVPADSLRPILATLGRLGTGALDLGGGEDGGRGFSLELPDQNGGAILDAMSDEPDALSTLNVSLRADHVWAARDPQAGVTIEVASGPPREALLRRILREDRALYPDARSVVIDTRDDVPYADTFAAVGVTRAEGYAQTFLSGGPPVTRDVVVPPLRPGAPPLVPAHVRIEPEGRLVVDGVALADLAHFVEDCALGDCALVAVTTSGAAVLVGRRPADDADPLRRWVFGRRVWPAPGYAAGLAAPSTEGALSAFPRVPSGLAAASTEGATLVSPSGATGSPILLGSLDKSVIDGAIKARMREIRTCYERGLVKKRDLAGRLAVRFVINVDGTVTDSRIAPSTLAAPEVEACVVAIFRTLVFPPPQGSGIVIVTYPFLFSPG